LEIVLPRPMKILGLITQGRKDEMTVTAVRLDYAADDDDKF